MTISDRPLNKIDKKTLGILKQMNIKGLMYTRLLYPRGNERAILLRQGKEKIGWAMVFPSSSTPKNLISYFYIRPKYRRKGYGLILGYYLDCNYSNVMVCPHDSQSKSFFANLPFSLSRTYV